MVFAVQWDDLNFKHLRIPVILRNLRGYDSHLIMQGSVGGLKNKTINCIPTFSTGHLDFIDSLQFMKVSLEKLVVNLAKEGYGKFHVLKRYIKESSWERVSTRTIIWKIWKNFKSNSSLLKKAFYSPLTEEHISDKDYQHAQTVFTSFRLQNLGQYHDLCLLSDVLLLANVFKNFRSICLNYYELDPAHYYTSPGLAWSACLKMTNVELESFTDPNMYLFVEEGIRGGISIIINRYGRANNPYVPSFDSARDKNYIMYLYANNLYGWAISQPLLTYDFFFWLTENEIRELDVLTVPDDNEEG